MAGKKTYSVDVPLVIAKTDSGDLYLYHGAPVPESVGADEIKRLLKGEFIVEGEAAPEDPDPVAVEAAAKAEAEKVAAEKNAADDKADADKAAAEAAAKK